MVENTPLPLLILLVSIAAGGFVAFILTNRFSNKLDKLRTAHYDELVTSYNKGVFDGREAEHNAIEYALKKVHSSGSPVYIAEPIDNTGTYISPESMISCGFTGYPDGYKLEEGETLESVEKKLRRSWV